MEDIMKMFKCFEQSGLLIKGVGETIKNKAKGQIGGFLAVLLCTSRASLFGSAL